MNTDEPEAAMIVYDPESDAAKMQALTRLAASIAKQLNKVVISFAAEADIMTNSEARLQPTEALIRKAANQVDAIASCLFDFAGSHQVSSRPVTVATAMLDLTPVLRSILDPAIDLQLACGPDLPQLYVDVSLLEQVICTLVARARDAMPDGGAVTITVGRSPQPDRRAPGQDWLWLEIADTGVPIAPEELPKVFEPILVTKGHGLWLGLATVYAAVRQMNGRIVVGPTGDQGTRFSLSLPSRSP
jgi:two-component system, cell cycle sensor histidine kinase and response regulator CckA